MLKEKLNGIWNLKIIGKDAALLPKEGIPAKVPGSVYGALLKEKLIPDPFFRDNELKVLPLMDNDFCFETTFEVTKQMLACRALLLHFDGIDTLADIYVNEELIGCAYNMHRIWEYDLLELAKLREGENRLRIVLHSPTKYIKEENEKVYTGGALECMEGFPHLRKAHCMFGWDWGPRLPDAGIFRDVTILGVESSRLDSVYITQQHEQGELRLTLIFPWSCLMEQILPVSGRRSRGFSLRLQIRMADAIRRRTKREWKRRIRIIGS